MYFSDTFIRRIGDATVIWGVVFAAVHFYWAAGGAALGVGEDRPSLAASLYIAFVAALGLAGAAVAYAVHRPCGAAFGRRRLRSLARLGAIVLLLGVMIGVGRWVAAGSLGDDGAGGIVITAYFLLGGALFTMLGWHGDRRLSQRIVRADARLPQALRD